MPGLIKSTVGYILDYSNELLELFGVSDPNSSAKHVITEANKLIQNISATVRFSGLIKVMIYLSS
jgi:hypothetical protein